MAGPILYLSAAAPGGRARFQQQSILTTPDTAGRIIPNYLAYFSPDFLFKAGDRNPMHSPPGFGGELRSVMPFLFAGLIWLVLVALHPAFRSRRKSALLLLAALVLYPAPGALTLPSPHTLRAAHVIPILSLVTATGITASADLIRWLMGRAQPAATRAVMALVLTIASLPLVQELLIRYYDYFAVYPDKVRVQFQYGLQLALEDAFAHEADYQEIWISDTNQPYIYVLFYRRWSPSEVHERLQVRRGPPAFNAVGQFGNYGSGTHFRDLSSMREKASFLCSTRFTAQEGRLLTKCAAVRHQIADGSFGFYGPSPVPQEDTQAAVHRALGWKVAPSHVRNRSKAANSCFFLEMSQRGPKGRWTSS